MIPIPVDPGAGAPGKFLALSSAPLKLRISARRRIVSSSARTPEPEMLFCVMALATLAPVHIFEAWVVVHMLV